MYKEIQKKLETVIKQYEPENPRPVLEQVFSLSIEFGIPDEKYIGPMRVTDLEYCTPERVFRELNQAFESTSTDEWNFHFIEAYQIIKRILEEI